MRWTEENESEIFAQTKKMLNNSNINSNNGHFIWIRKVINDVEIVNFENLKN